MKRKTLTIVAAAVGTLVGLCCIGVIVAAANTPDNPTSSTTTVAASRPTSRPNDAAPTRGIIVDPKVGQGAATDPTTRTTPPPPVAATRPPTIDDGTWTVVEDIPAGTYKVTTPIPADAFCYWAIYKAGTNKRDIVANDLPQGGTPKVTLKAGQEFETNGCGTWAKTA